MYILLIKGVIFNILTLKKTYKIKSTGTENILIELYNLIGFCNMIKQLDGTFAIILKTKTHIYLARDRMGICPLYNYKTLYSFIPILNYTLIINGVLIINLPNSICNEIYYYTSPTYQTITSNLYFYILFNKSVRQLTDNIIIEGKLAYIKKNEEISKIILNTLENINVEVTITTTIEDNYIYISDYGFEKLFTRDIYNDNYTEISHSHGYRRCIFPFLNKIIVDFFITIDTSKVKSKKKYFTLLNKL